MYILTGVAEACIQLELLSISNSNGQVTDYKTTQDEISAWFGSDWKDESGNINTGIIYTFKKTVFVAY